jgi:hypothetical protein
MADHDGDGVPDAATAWPTYLDSTAEQQALDLSRLIARYVGVNITSVSATTVVVNFLVFEPASPLPEGDRPHFSQGFPTVRIFQDPSTAGAPSDPLSDICAPEIGQLTLNGTAGGATYRQNPGDGSFYFTTYAASFADEDNDGIENPLDPCPTTANVTGWDPRGQLTPGAPGDEDADGLPSDCDPDPDQPSQCNALTGIPRSDEDCDGWQNRGDNCPLVQNPSQDDADGDQIGDACDPNPEMRGQTQTRCMATQVTIGSGGSWPPDPLQMPPCGPPIDICNTLVCTTPTPTPAPTETPGRLPDAGGARSGQSTPPPWRFIAAGAALLLATAVAFRWARRA